MPDLGHIFLSLNRKRNMRPSRSLISIILALLIPGFLGKAYYCASTPAVAETRLCGRPVDPPFCYSFDVPLFCNGVWSGLEIMLEPPNATNLWLIAARESVVSVDFQSLTGLFTGQQIGLATRLRDTLIGTLNQYCPDIPTNASNGHGGVHALPHIQLGDSGSVNDEAKLLPSIVYLRNLGLSVPQCDANPLSAPPDDWDGRAIAFVHRDPASPSPLPLPPSPPSPHQTECPDKTSEIVLITVLISGGVVLLLGIGARIVFARRMRRYFWCCCHPRTFEDIEPFPAVYKSVGYADSEPQTTFE